MKTMSILGTRPEMIKMSRIISSLDEVSDHVFVHTGQNFDPNLRDIFYEDLGLRYPDHAMDAHGNSLSETLAMTLCGIEQILDAERPDAVVIHGDTNSALAGIIVKRKKIPLFHLEAGNRCFDDNVPEEINRRIIDHISDVNMTYSENGRRYLISEGIRPERIFLMGSPMREVLEHLLPRINQSSILDSLGLTPDGYLVASIHRDENLSDRGNLMNIMNSLFRLSQEFGPEIPIIVSTHPKLKQVAGDFDFPDSIVFCDPFPFTDYISLQRSALCVLSDSGTISEESAILGFPAVTIRNAIERPEAIDAGSIIMSGTDPRSVVDLVLSATMPSECPSEYMVSNCSDRVSRVVLGYTDYINRYVWRRS